MSATCAASLLVGVKLSDILRVEDFVSKKTKYHEDTGQPYEVDVPGQRLYLGSLEITTSEVIKKYDVCSPEEWVAPLTGLSAASTGAYAYGDGGMMREQKIGWHRYDYREWVIGKLLGETGSRQRIATVALPDVGKAVEETATILRKFGYSGPINMHLVRYFS